MKKKTCYVRVRKHGHSQKMYKMHEKTHEKTSILYNKSENIDVFQNMYKMHVLLKVNIYIYIYFSINLPYSI